jgi:adenine-specific DNA methylase
MSLENYVKNSWLKKEATSPQEIADQLGIVSRSIKDAGVEGISDDLRFYTAFNAILALANTALRASGYRTTNQQGHHTRTIETLEYTIKADDKTIRKIMAFSKKRNVASYDSAGSISDEELKQILSTAGSLKETVETWLIETHPELLKR